MNLLNFIILILMMKSSLGEIEVKNYSSQSVWTSSSDQQKKNFHGKLSGFGENDLVQSGSSYNQRYVLPDTSDDGRCQNPVQPQNGIMFCNSNSGEEKMCLAKCNLNFAFPGGEKEKRMYCRYSLNTWVPSMSFPDCLPGAGGLSAQSGDHSASGSHEVKKTVITKTVTHTSSSSGGTSSFSGGDLHGADSFQPIPQSISSYCPYPPSPKSGSINCKVAGKSLECVGRCRSGYYFPDGETNKILTCSVDTKSWSPSPNFPECEPSCEPKCQNNGQCIGYNQCFCPSSFRGIACQYSEELCDGSTLKFNGNKQCSHSKDGSICTLSCPIGMKFALPTATTQVTCDIYGNWSPSTIQDCVFVDGSNFGIDQSLFGSGSHAHSSSGTKTSTLTKVVKTTHYDQSSGAGIGGQHQTGIGSGSSSGSDELAVSGSTTVDKSTGSHASETTFTSTIQTFTSDDGRKYIDFSYCPSPNGLFAHPEVCSLFLNCYNNRAYVQPCAANLHFNEQTGACDYPANVNCGSRWSGTLTQTVSKTGGGGGSDSGDILTSGSHQSTIVDKNTKTTYTTKIQTFTTDNGRRYIDFSYCPRPTGLFAHPEVCSWFLNCYDNRAYVQPCAADLVFNELSGACDYRANVDCGTRLGSVVTDGTGDVITSGSHESTIIKTSHESTIPVFTTNDGQKYLEFSYCPLSSGLFPHPEYCNLYLNCAQNRAYIQSCAADLYFNQKTKVCDFKRNVDCGSRGISSADLKTSSSVHKDFTTTKTTFKTTIVTHLLETGETVVDFSYCPQGIGHFPHPEICSLFLRCHSQKAYVEKCPNNMLFNDIANVCQPKNFVDCGSRWAGVYTDADKDSTNQGKIQTDLESSGSHQTTTIETFVNEHGETETSYSYCQTPIGNNRHPEFCFMYLYCFNHKAIVKTCPENKFFSETTYQCETIDKVNCGSRQTTKVENTIKTYKDSAGRYFIDYVYCNGQFGPLPHPVLCDKYLNCDQTRAYVQSCPANTLFNSEKKICDFPHNVKCKHQTTTTTTTTTTVTYYVSTIKTTIISTGETIIDYSYCKTLNGKFPFEHCGLFIDCKDNRAYVHRCPEGMYFDDQLFSCTFKQNVNCGTRVTTTIRETDFVTLITSETFTDHTFCSWKSGYFPHPDDCSKFISCENQAVYVMTCPQNLLFNPLTKYCDYSENVNCGNRQIFTTFHNSSYVERWLITETGVTKSYVYFCGTPQGVFAHPFNCKWYLSCDHESVSVLKCSNELRFDDVQKKCRYSNEVNCGLRPILTVSSDLKTEESNTKETFVDYHYCSSRIGNFPHPDDCSKYINCETGLVYVTTCPKNLLYNTALRFCDYPENVNCGIRTEFSSFHNDTFVERWLITETGTSKSIIHFCKKAQGVFSHPYNCNWFLNCGHGSVHVQKCQPGLHFNEANGQCDYPANVNCGSRPILIGTGITDIDVSETTIVETTVKYFKSSGKCAVWGRYHYRTFDGKVYNFKGSCTYLLAKDCTENTFSIYLVNSAGCSISDGICQRKIIIEIGDDKYVLQNSPTEIELYENDKLLPIPSTKRGLIFQYLYGYVMVTHAGLDIRLIWDGDLTVVLGTLSVNSKLKDKTCGLCGNYNDDVSDDFLLSNGKISKTVPFFVNDWSRPSNQEKCNQIEHLTDSCANSSPEVALAATKHCEMILKTTFNKCHDVVEPKLYFEACRIDYCGCTSSSRADCTCGTINEYASQCTRLDSSLKINWRTPEICGISCPASKVFRICASSCTATCHNDVTNCVDDICIDGCQCPEGKVLYDGKCIDRVDCPCKLRDQFYSNGASARKDCNSCLCEKGSWTCTKNSCSATCSAIGDPHYKTFDGKRYSFMGKCSYYLLKTEKYSITQENVACDGAISKKLGYHTPPNAFPSCTKSITITLGDAVKVHLKQNLEVIINDKEIQNLPIRVPGMIIYQASSLFLKVEMFNGIKILWDGISRVYIESPPDLQNSMLGLCGNFNLKQNDEFTTPEGDIEGDVDAFANKWKVYSSCEDIPVGDDGSKFPCELNAHRKENAELVCSKLKSDLFEDCHSHLDPEPFYQNCLYDLCSCNDENSDCLCTALADYAAQCAKAEIIIDWRSLTPKCGLHCMNEQIYQTCADSCKATCRAISMNENCLPDCTEGCNCPPGSALNSNNECIEISDCSCYFDNKEYSAGYEFIYNSTKCTCTNAKWKCQPATYNDKENLESICSDSDHKEYVQCKKSCQKQCDGIEDNCVEHPFETCEPGCLCKDGYLYDPTTDSCWKDGECPCHHGGKIHNEGSSVNKDCNKCICENGHWNCEDNDCHSVCTIWGASNIQTFDGHIFSFKGDCKYILMKARINDGRSLVISSENVPCGTSGVTCSKFITISIDNIVIKLSPDGVTGANSNSDFQVYEKGLFFVVHSDFGITLSWDKKTRLYIQVSPTWKSSLKGLCGDFDGNSNNDFNSPNGDFEFLNAANFAEAWKTSQNCPESLLSENMCEVHSSRKTWAYEKCHVLKSDLFAKCHTEVPVGAYFESCVSDTCGCDTGGDCECLCTSIAVYAHLCNLEGIFVNWRSQDLCPIQCPDHCDEYNPCLSTCPTLTCENFNDTSSQGCEIDVCVEGCDVKKCPSGQVLKSNVDKICVPISDCVGKCVLSDNSTFKNGERIIHSSIDKCVTCHCKKGELKCVGEPCPTISTTTAATTIERGCVPGWSHNFNDFDPWNSEGDFEDVSNIMQDYNFCSGGVVTDIECKAIVNTLTNETKDWTKSGDVDVICTTEKGLICKNDDQPSGKTCYDYEIKLKCFCDKIRNQVKNVTKSVCPDDQVMDDCAFNCSQTCNSFQHVLKNQGYCNKDNGTCVPGCRPKDPCESNKVWREDKKCVTPLECTCRLDDGTILPPGGVLEKECEKCTCYHNVLHCYTLSRCFTTTPVIIESSTTTPATSISTRSEQDNCWTRWFNIDEPYSSGGDYEIITDIRRNFEFCKSPVAIECRTATSKTMYPKTNEEVTCDLNEGAVCLNGKNVPDGCSDYEIRLYCPCKTTTPLPGTPGPCVSGWTKWINSHTSNGFLDYETIQDSRNAGNDFCSSDKIINVQCNDSSSSSFSSCSLKDGMICQSSAGNCPDIAVRYYCQCEETTTTIESTTPESTTPESTTPKSITPSCNQWSVWINNDSPETGLGDQENIPSDNIRFNNFCTNGYVTNIECYSVTTSQYYNQTTDLSVICSIENGLSCFNNNQTNDWSCEDYKIRYYCSCDESKTTQSTVVPPKITISPLCSKSNLFTFLDGDNQIPDENITASSDQFHHEAYLAKFSKDKGWVPAADDASPYIEVDLGQAWRIYGIVTKGIADAQSWTTSYEVQYSIDRITFKKYMSEKNEPQEFPANNDSRSEVVHYFRPFDARYVRIIPLTWKYKPVLKFDLYGCNKTLCSESNLFTFLDGDNQISDESITASSDQFHHEAYLAKFSKDKGWVPAANDATPYIEVDLGQTWPIYGIVTKGIADAQSWTTAYEVWYSIDRITFKKYMNEKNEPQKFPANYDSRSEVVHYFRPFDARYVRIIPLTWIYKPVLKFDLYGCSEIESTTTQFTTVVVVPSITTVLPLCSKSNFFTFLEGDNQIPDESIAASSEQFHHEAYLAKFSKDKGWVPADDDATPYIEVDLGQTWPIYGIVTKGIVDAQSWTTSYEIWYSIDSIAFMKYMSEENEPKAFQANYDSRSEVVHYFRPFDARYVRIKPLTWKYKPALKFDLYGCSEITTTSTILTTTAVPKCDQPLGLENNVLDDSQIEVTSLRYPDFGVDPVRLNSNALYGPGAWIAKSKDLYQHVQLDFIHDTAIERIVTQGRDNSTEWVTAYKVSYLVGSEFKFIRDQEGHVKTFSANYDSNSEVSNSLNPPLRTRVIRIHPTAWSNWIAMRIEVFGCFQEYPEKCKMPIGMENLNIKDSWLTTSSYAGTCDASFARLNLQTTCGGWVAKGQPLEESYIQVDLQKTANITGIITQGRHGYDHWITSFKVSCSDDSLTWKPCAVDSSNKLIFDGNFNNNASIYNYFKEPVITRYIRILPVRWHKFVALRFELLGCYIDIVPTTLPPIPITTTDPCFKWSEWVNTASATIGSDGEIEPISDIIEAAGTCLSPVKIECRDALSGIPLSEDDQVVVTCDLSDGISCSNSKQPFGICLDYEARIACWECGLTTTEPPLHVCPNVTETWFCPSCSAGLVCDGSKCVDPINCPCFIEDQRINVGDIYVTKDCKECKCLLNGKINCEHHECPSCPLEERPLLSEKCECKCEKCPNGSKLCSSDNICINENKWCDGYQDCQDDEKNCIFTTTIPPTPTTTRDPNKKVWCDVSNNIVKTFDDQEYSEEICNHVILSDKIEGAFNVTLKNDCDEPPSALIGSAEKAIKECTKLLSINVDDVEVKIGTELDVQFNGHSFTASQLVLLSKKRSDLDISIVGNSVLFYSTKYGFEIFWDIRANLHIDVDDQLRGKINGICGFYNDNPTDDKQKKNGDQSVNVKDFLDSWAIEDEAKACPSRTCPPDLVASSLKTCEKLFEKPFEECLSVMSANERKFHLRSCINNLCKCKVRNGTGSDDCKCNAYLPYVTECLSRLEKKSLEWRVLHNCVGDCPYPLQWHDCGSACEKRCDNYKNDTCENKKCVSGCFCPTGLVRKGDECVKPNKCYNQICSSYGDPHFTTFDGTHFTFNGNCSYVLVNSKDKECPMLVEGDTGPCSSAPDTGALCLTKILIKYDGIEIITGTDGIVYVDYKALEQSEIPYETEKISIQTIGGAVTIIQIHPIEVEIIYYSMNNGFRIKIPSTAFNGNLEGLCGNSNFKKSDDFTLRDGSITTNIKTFVHSWVASQYSVNQCFVTSPEINEDKLNGNEDLCSEFKQQEFKSCNILLDPKDFIKNCRVDSLAKYKSPQTALCDNLIEYSRSCCDLGVHIDSWISKYNCSLPCKDGKIFKSCAYGCKKDCDNFEKEIECELPPVDGCFCPDHLIEKDGKCVDPAICDACDDEGHLIDEVWNEGPCASCLCKPGKRIDCMYTECPLKPICNADETLKILNINDTYKCCPDYLCVVNSECKHGKTPTCNKPGQVMKTIVLDNGCKNYTCECNTTLCPPLVWPVLKPGQINVTRKEECCKIVETICKPELCDPPLDCPAYFNLKKVKGACCSTYYCESPPDVCIYNHVYEIVDGKEVLVETDKQVQEQFNRGDQWKDGLCRTCECVNTTGLYSSSCYSHTCPTIDELPDKDEYEYETDYKYNQCCPDFKRINCKDEFGNVKKVGESWPSLNDTCLLYKCVRGIQKDMKIIERKTKCNKNCIANMVYVEAPYGSEECCGKCESYACIENGQIHEVGKTWESESKRCYEGKCINTNGTIDALYTHVKCPPLSADCPKQHIIFDESGCCEKCNITPGACSPKNLESNKTIGLITIQHPDHGECKNQEAIDIFECEGKCLSHSIYSPSSDSFESLCHCCTPKTWRNEMVMLMCSDYKTVLQEIKQPLTCTCERRCSSIQQSLKEDDLEEIIAKIELS